MGRLSGEQNKNCSFRDLMYIATFEKGLSVNFSDQFSYHEAVAFCDFVCDWFHLDGSLFCGNRRIASFHLNDDHLVEHSDGSSVCGCALCNNEEREES